MSTTPAPVQPHSPRLTSQKTKTTPEKGSDFAKDKPLVILSASPRHADIMKRRSTPRKGSKAETTEGEGKGNGEDEDVVLFPGTASGESPPSSPLCADNRSLSTTTQYRKLPRGAASGRQIESCRGPRSRPSPNQNLAAGKHSSSGRSSAEALPSGASNNDILPGEADRRTASGRGKLTKAESGEFDGSRETPSPTVQNMAPILNATGRHSGLQQRRAAAAATSSTLRKESESGDVEFEEEGEEGVGGEGRGGVGGEETRDTFEDKRGESRSLSNREFGGEYSTKPEANRRIVSCRQPRKK